MQLFRTTKEWDSNLVYVYIFATQYIDITSCQDCYSHSVDDFNLWMFSSKILTYCTFKTQHRCAGCMATRYCIYCGYVRSKPLNWRQWNFDRCHTALPDCTGATVLTLWDPASLSSACPLHSTMKISFNFMTHPARIIWLATQWQALRITM